MISTFILGRNMYSNADTAITRQASIEANDREKDLVPAQTNMMSNDADCILDQSPPFCLNEEQRQQKSFQERKSDVDQAIKWIVKEIVSSSVLDMIIF